MGGGSCLREVAAYPDYGAGVGGWRRDVAVNGNLLAGLGVGGAAALQGSGSLYSWLLAQARAVDPALLSGPLPSE